MSRPFAFHAVRRIDGRCPPALCLLALVCLVGPLTSSAGAVEAILGGGLLVAEPEGELAENLEETGVGGFVSGGVWIGELPLLIGLEGGGLVYESDHREVPLIGFPAVNAQLEIKSHIYPVHVMFRIGGRRGMIRPYVDGLLGIKIFETTTQIRLKENSQETFAEDTKSEDAAFSYGASAGLMFRVMRTRPDLAEGDPGGDGGDTPLSLLINLRVGYLAGTEADYVKESSITPTGGDATYEMSRSTTHLTVVQLGVLFHFY